MANLLKLVKMTVSELRELARKYLGHGHGRLKSKSELIAALKQKLTPPPKKAAPTRAKSAPKRKPAPKKEPAQRPPRRVPAARVARVSAAAAPIADIVAPRPQPQAVLRPRFLSEDFFAGAQAPTTGLVPSR